ncbi:sushi domain-containing protein 2 isoform X1 [Gallus gallus]|uniref:sushi domain-containing protein 2 isoform X1 n=1 Tax=Gallus gallus TaxID=9031 RepID=UPI001AE79FA5|nr:sushi domain-containing protein 2 isoform X1 [Gallus gallus]XP_040540698.1 sushi domain-containing protein 2 isoform X1 [Gallus gallus]XP_046784347.1 sushi domain-containing protein 2 isoform X1 [Gallus gallus]
MECVGAGVPLFILFSLAALWNTGAQDSCSSQCGKLLGACSCQEICQSLGTCCPDYNEFCLHISPYSGSLMGGKDFLIENTAFNTSVLMCRFKQQVITSGYVDKDGKAHCLSPLLYETGFIPFEVSTDGGLTFPYSGTWLSVHHSKVSGGEKCTLVNETKWQYYGTPGTGGNLTLTWTHQALAASHINIEVWGYQETGDSYSENWLAEWKYLYTLAREAPNTGTFSFIPVPAEANYNTWDFGILRITPSTYSDGQSNTPSIWSPAHALAWHLGEDFRNKPAAWATAKCIEWDREEEKLPNFMEEIIDCPCTLAQARADTGRFHTDYGCDIEKGSVCTYHPGAVHCVRAIQASPQYGAGQQCCYDSTGTQILTQDSTGGSTPDRGHDWGAPPFLKPPRIPAFSHWLYDVISFYYCCLWSDNCHFYMKNRPSSDCRTYRPPRAASAFGDPHFLTFDGLNFTFKGQGEYILVESDLTSLRVQGRTQQARFPNGTQAQVTGLSAVAMQENNSDVIEVRYSEDLNLEVLLNQRVVNFSEQSWMDLEGLFLHSMDDQKVTVMFSSGSGVEIRGSGGFLTLTVLLPEKFMNHTQGLFGVMNGNTEDEFTFKNKTTMSVHASPQQLFEFGASWAVENGTSLFTYDTETLLNDYFYGEKHNASFLPVFHPHEDPADPLVEEMVSLCDSDPFCRFDVLTTRSLQAGNFTRLSHQNHKQLVESLEPVISCGWLGPPTNGRKDGTNYLLGSAIHITCNQGYELAGTKERICQATGAWSGDSPSCILRSDIKQVIALACVFGVVGLAVVTRLILLYRKERHRAKQKLVSKEPVTSQQGRARLPDEFSMKHGESIAEG